jgi:GNAT superfamily N-acetyltransferase
LLTRLTNEGVESVLDDTYPIWGEGLTRPAYGQWNRAQADTVWGRDYLSRVGLLDGPHLVASAKRYILAGSIDGRPAPILGIGAVFTPPGRRGRGHATALVESMLADGAAHGCVAALLFSEIGPAFYERLGFVHVPRTTTVIEPVATGRGAPAMLVRSGDDRDLADVAGISARRAAGAAFALDRSASFIAFGLTRRRLLAGLGGTGLRSVEFFVTEEAHRAVAYVVLTHGPLGTRLEDCGDLDPSGARLGAMLQVLSARAPAERPIRAAGWLPHGLRPPQIRVLAEHASAEVMMRRSIGDHPAIPAGETAYCYLDAF